MQRRRTHTTARTLEKENVFERNMQHGKSERKNELHMYVGVCLSVSRSDQISYWLSICLPVCGCLDQATGALTALVSIMRISPSLTHAQHSFLHLYPSLFSLSLSGRVCAQMRVCYFRNELKLAQLQQTCNVVGSGSAAYGRTGRVSGSFWLLPRFFTLLTW